MKQKQTKMGEYVWKVTIESLGVMSDMEVVGWDWVDVPSGFMLLRGTDAKAHYISLRNVDKFRFDPVYVPEDAE